MSQVRTFAIALLALLPLASMSEASDWARFRGPNGSGVSPDSQPAPEKWSGAENLRWKTALPGAGVSCPIVVGNRVIVTCYSGYGVSRDNVGQMDDLKRHVVCVDRATGEIQWQQEVAAVLPEDRFSGMGVPEHGYASHTPVSDGEHVYVFFGKTGALAFDLYGKKLWQTSVGTGSDDRQWGSASSPILYKNLLIVPATAESQSLVALDKSSGKEVWRQQAGGLNSSWSTPILVETEGRTDLVLGVPFEIWGCNPDSGKLRWYCNAVNSNSFYTSVVAVKDQLFAIEGRDGGSVALKAGGKGDTTEGAVIWKGNATNRFGTPVAYDGQLYYVSNGVVTSLGLADGKKVSAARLAASGAAPQDNNAGNDNSDNGRPRSFGGRGRGGGGGSDYSSPVIADNKLYYVARNGDMHVFSIGKELKSLAVNRVTDDREDFSATPAISNGELFVRSSKHLYCISQQER
ncbi:MAG: PQQ-binding-like beta-propeller repeat protein [Planctomycetales bacterium]|nr:PQQ-binding-like beta-propeller repeat protein [Planctomycetales bacterium]